MLATIQINPQLIVPELVDAQALHSSTGSAIEMGQIVSYLNGLESKTCLTECPKVTIVVVAVQLQGPENAIPL